MKNRGILFSSMVTLWLLSGCGQGQGALQSSPSSQGTSADGGSVSVQSQVYTLQQEIANLQAQVNDLTQKNEALSKENEALRMQTVQAVAAQTEEEKQALAAQLVKNYVLPQFKGNPQLLRVAYDHMDGQLYVVHAYEQLSDHVATFGWYEVDLQKGTITQMTP